MIQPTQNAAIAYVAVLHDLKRVSKLIRGAIFSCTESLITLKDYRDWIEAVEAAENPVSEENLTNVAEGRVGLL